MSYDRKKDWLNSGGAMVELLTLLHQDVERGTDSSGVRLQQLNLYELRGVTAALLGAIYGVVVHGAQDSGESVAEAIQRIGLLVHHHAEGGLL